MEENLALKLLRILRRYAKGETLTDDQVRKHTGLWAFFAHEKMLCGNNVVLNQLPKPKRLQPQQ